MRAAVLAMLLSIGALMALAVAHVGRRHASVRLGYELSEATAELRALAEENRRLRVERSLLRNPDRIERLAGELGMARPDPSRIRVVPGARSLATTAPEVAP